MEKSQFSQIGGHHLLNLANTVCWRLDESRRVDLLDSPRAAEEWLEQVVALDGENESPRQSGKELLSVLRAVREDFYLSATAADGRAFRRLLGRHQRWLNQCTPVISDDGQWNLTAGDSCNADPEDRMGSEAVTLLTSPDAAQIKQCSDASCGWIYLDTSRRHNRLWCRAEDCGTRNRSRRYYQSHRNEPGNVDS